MKETKSIITGDNLHSALNLPSEKDFGGCLDAKSAWKHFGGLDLDSAYTTFCENPLFYQEDFMFMGASAFQFYFPVIDRFLRDARHIEGQFDGQAWILAKAISSQMENPLPEDLIGKIEKLCYHVRDNLSQYGECKIEQEEIDNVWLEVEKRVVELKSREH